MIVRRWLCAAVLIAAGCDGRSVVPVSGRVTLNGLPLNNAVVLFQPFDRDNPGTGSSGRTDADGRFTLRQIHPDRPGAWPGWHHVTITRGPQITGREDLSDFPITFLVVPPDFEVPPGGAADANFKVTVVKPK